ncbi:hypothetical protein JTE90_024255 [Oedothorax gibbosus]|uniref:Uncharacterized protein n=1 Tax=Oedothorax gibbosus TaxID=931172 RepID=A0AAV6VMS9_9ARAC|nr:hypothetical protein JTE90_024255 [Oedothorax gibbosus]
MERNGDVIADFNYCPGRFRINTNDLLDSKMCKDDVNESIFCGVPKSMKNVVLSTDTVQSALKNLLASKQNFLDSDELMWKNSDSYNLSSSKTMPLISKESFLNGKLVLDTSNSSFQIENCFSSKSGIASEASLDTNSDSLQQTFDEENSSSSIEEIFCPIASKAAEVKSKYETRVELSQNVCFTKVKQELTVELNNFSSPQKEANPCLEERGEPHGQKKDRVMPELIPTLICLDDDDNGNEEENEDSVHSHKESPPAANIAGSPEMPKLIPFSVESDLLRVKAGHSNESKNIKCPSVDLQSCTRKLFPDAAVVDFENLKFKHKQLSPPLKDNVKEVGFSFSSSFKPSKQGTQELNCGVDLSQKGTKKCRSKSKSLDGEIPELLKDSEGETKSEHSDCNKVSYKKAKKRVGQINIDKKIDHAKDSVSDIRQPKVLLRRISLDQVSGHGIKKISSNGKSEKITFENCLPKDSNDNSLTSQPVCDDNSSNEAPEIEEIEGVRFFQFRSKHDMEEFNRKPMVGEDEMELIVPTKTTDITLIKGWRNKYFANDSQLHYIQSDDGNSRDESSQNAKSVPMLAGSNESKFLDFRNCLKDNKTKSLDVKFHVDSSPVEPKKEHLKSDTKELKPETKETVKYEKPSNAMSAFVSKDLDNFLKNSATLNIQLLQKVNPNITPILKGDGILSLGKLRQPDYKLNTLAALKKRNFLNKLKEDKKPQVPAIYSSDSDDAVVVISSSEESSTEDDVPVASLNSGRKRMATSNPDTVSLISSIKRRKSDASLDGASQRVVLRLTKGNQGPSDNYKVFGVSSEKHDSEYSPSSTSSSSTSSESSSSSSSEDSEVEEIPDEFKTNAEGKAYIKESIFLNVSEAELLGEFLTNMNVLGTNKDMTMLVQSNESYYGQGPVLQTETCADALDALLTTKEYIDLKNKRTPKKKLKAWQKYLPKKVTKDQKQKYTIVPCVPKKLADIDKKPTKPEISGKSESVKDEKLSTKPKLKRFKLKKTITEIEKPKPGDEIVNVKCQVPVSNDVPKVRKRRSRSALDPCDPLLLLERGKRSIRLPARYLDSAVLAAGSEWVSPIFVEDDKKTRKQLLDVLGKISSNKESSGEPKKVIAKKQELSVSEEQMVKKTTNDNIQPNKAIKRQIKTTNTVKKIKFDEVAGCLRIEESDSSNNQNGLIDKKVPKLPKDDTYLMPSCPCWPCSRTMSYKKSTKEFLCLTHNPILEKQNNSKFVLASKTSQESTLNESIPADIEIIRSTGPIFGSHTEEKISSVENKVSEGSESIHPNKTLSILSDSPPVVGDEKMLTTKEAVKDISKKMVFVLPVNKGTTNNSLPSKSQPVLRTKEHQISAHKALQLALEMRGKPPILIRKPVPENSSSNTPNTETTSAPVLSPPPVTTGPSVVFKLPSVYDNRFVKLAPKPLPQATSEKQLPNINANSLQQSNTPQQSSLPSQDPSKPVMKGFKIGNVNFYLEQGQKNNSCHPVLKYLANKLSPSSLSTVISNGANNSASDSKSPTKSETDSSALNKVDEALTSPKVSLDLHNYNKKLERRRKSPLSQRVFNESPESKKILGQLSDSDVDVDTVDEQYNPKLALKQQQLANSSGSDASDIDCDEIFTSDINNVIFNGLEKSIRERKRRLYIKRSFERLKGTTPFFNGAKGSAEILTKATFAVQKLKTKEIALRQAKRILRFHNGHLLEELAKQIKDIKEPEMRNRLKKQIITDLANDWTTHRKKNNSTRTKRKKKLVTTSLETNKDVSVNGTESQIEAPSKQFELNEIPKMGLHDSSISFEMASKETEEPVVQLRILELPSSETDKDILSLLDSQIEVRSEETIPPQTQGLDLSQPSSEKKPPVPEALDENNSDDDDLLVIDLEGYAADNASPKKVWRLFYGLQSSRPSHREMDMDNFPGLVPLYPSEFYEADNPFALDLSKFSALASTSSSQMFITNAGERHEKSKPSGLSVSPRKVPHRTTKDIKILHGVGNSPDDEDIKEVVIPKPTSPKVLEEIVIGDSDDESMDTEQTPNYSSTIDSVVIKTDSPIKSLSS